MGDFASKSDFWPRFQLPLYLFLIGLTLIALGILSFRFLGDSVSDFEVEVIEPEESSVIMVDLSGAVLRPGVYELENGSRINDLLIKAGGLSAEADRDWVARNLNLVDELSDGQKFYLPFQGEESGEDKININQASLSQLESLSGIGEKRARDIVEGRPYGVIDDLVNKGIVSAKIFTEMQEKIAVY